MLKPLFGKADKTPADVVKNLRDALMVIDRVKYFQRFFVFVQSDVFDIATDAFSTFKDLMTKHKNMCSEYLENNYDRFFSQYAALTNSENYVTRRQSLKLLGELLLDRHNFSTMNKYITSPENLKTIMELLRDKRRNIQYEAFHVFKTTVFTDF
uniref:Protein Mo25 n=1 Tax=Caenorhabditis japonica TaxID=281687 RepID=A0A8R1IST1_CAEJA